MKHKGDLALAYNDSSQSTGRTQGYFIVLFVSYHHYQILKMSCFAVVRMIGPIHINLLGTCAASQNLRREDSFSWQGGDFFFNLTWIESNQKQARFMTFSSCVIWSLRLATNWFGTLRDLAAAICSKWTRRRIFCRRLVDRPGKC